MKNYLKAKLDVPENWDKFDYQTHRYSFDDVEELLTQYQEEKLVLSLVTVWVSAKNKKPDNTDQVFVKYENGKYGINEWWESDNCWKYQFDNMVVKEWCNPPC
jgi:hypothetical protein